MSCFGPSMKKGKRKSKSKNVELTSLNKKWASCDIDPNIAFDDGTSMDGFMELDELNDYDEDEIKAIMNATKKSKPNKKLGNIIKVKADDIEDVGCEENEEANDVEDQYNSGCDETEQMNNGQIKKEVKSVDTTTDEKLSKKERRKQARKLSFKLKLKERRKKFKEEKKLKTSESIKVEEIREVVLSKSESFELKSTIRNDMDEWVGLGVPNEILKALAENNFLSPTPIQRECLPQAILYRQDIIGAAETGSGKTLAFGIPLIKNIMDLKEKGKENEDEDTPPLYSLIISPTRELALQIKEHIDKASQHVNIQCVAVVGGLATAKQERLISKCPEIIVGTPGRLHQLILDGCEHLNKFETLKHLVIDEADRMLEQGHYKELSDILEMINRVHVKRQIFVMSATLTLPQQHKGYRHKNKNKEEKSEMQVLIDKVGINPKAKVIDLTSKHVTASQLEQLRVLCGDEEKDFYMVYFLLMNPGRSIVFVNSISCTRRLCSLLTLLGFTPYQLHSGKQQRQRLKFLERFTASENGVLVATDVAARGLDIPKVCNVIHYQLPNDPKVYIHRAGRTARASETGISFVLEGPQDFSALKKICAVLKLGKDMPSLKTDSKIIEGIKTRVKLAREIDQEEYKIRKENADNSWLKKTAESMDIETDEVESNVLTKREKIQMNAKRKQLQNLLEEKLYPSGFSGSYPTKSGSLIVPGVSMVKKSKQ